MPDVPHSVHTVNANVAEHGNFCEGGAVYCGQYQLEEGPPWRVHTQGDCGITMLAEPLLLAVCFSAHFHASPDSDIPMS